MIAILFSILTVVTGFTEIAYVPIAGDKAVDIAIVGFVFAALIGGYRFSIPLAIVWSLITHYNLPPEFNKWLLWEMIAVRIVLGISLVFAYNLAKKIHRKSPYNVYRAVIFGIAMKAIVGIPIEIIHRGWPEGLYLRGTVFILESALCCLFMSLLIKHLRQIHILNGVRKKGEKDCEDESIISG